MRPTLDEIAKTTGTDKSSLSHNYTAVYEAYLGHLRDEKISLLELGWGENPDPADRGASARMWREYFPNATIVVIDLFDQDLDKRSDGIVFRQGDQSDPEFLNSLSKEFGPWDVIVDDASHISSLTNRSFEILFPHLAGGGLYFCEDMHSSYHSWFYGSDDANPDPRKNGMKSVTSTNFFLDVSHDVDRKFFDKKYRSGYNIDWYHRYPDLVALKKSFDV